ncbi:MAG: OB-fold nucleic acid binding domain-containing protein, partial [Candidatus Margulisiibacteriota bacterium]
MDIQYVKGVGSALAKKLERLNIRETSDLLTFFPTSYQDRRKLPKIKNLKPDENQLVQGRVVSVSETQKGSYQVTQVVVCDETGQLACIWFNQPYLKKIIKVDTELFLSGKVEFDFVSRRKILKVNDYEWVDEENVGRIIPQYPLTKGVYQKQLRGIIKRGLLPELKTLEDPFLEAFREKYQLIPLARAIYYFHYPKDGQTYLQAKKR